MMVSVKFTYGGCEAAFVEPSTDAAMAAVRELLKRLPNNDGPGDGPVLVADCPGCGAAGVRFSYAGAQEWPDQGVPPILLWTCPRCESTVSTVRIVEDA